MEGKGNARKKFTLLIPPDIHAELVKAAARYQSLQGFIMCVLVEYLKTHKE